MGKVGSKSERNANGVDFKALSKSTPFSVPQLKQWYQEFQKDCPKGCMTKEIFLQNFRDFFFPNDLLADYIFNRFDTNKDGVITFDEFINAVAVPAKGSIDEKLDWAFSIYDADEDGFVSQQEMIDILKSVYERKGLPVEQCTAAQRNVEQIFVNMDVNKDGRLSREEFKQGFKNDPSIFRSLLAQQMETEAIP